MRALLHSLGERWTAWRNARHGQKILCTPEALRIERAFGEPAQIPWNQIERVTAVKRDCYTVDSIRLLIGLKGGSALRGLRGGPGMAGPARATAERLPGCLSFEEWFFDVAFPAFEANAKQIYPPQQDAAGGERSQQLA
ncbi:MAG: hypothetical protein R2748_15710 [Bryobacterales bacterium]